jgi:hypothetical protein
MRYTNGTSSCQIAGAIALATVQDLKVNSFAFPGFPQISVSENHKAPFKITFSFIVGERISAIEFEISEDLGFKAGKQFTTDNTYPKELFEPVQEALAKLEQQVSYRG